ncbi:Transcription factor bHLH52 [Bienertia sinuspersici]
MSLDWHYPNNYTNQIHPFHCHQFQPQYQNETEFFCFDPLPLHPLNSDDHLLHYHHDYDLNTLNNNSIFSSDEDYSTQFLPFFPKQEKISHFPCFTNGVFRFPEFFANPETEVVYDGDFRRNEEAMMLEKQYNDPNNSYCCHYDYGDYNYGGNEENLRKIKDNVSAQSKAARERRRKIKEKTNELGKLIPGSSKMNTAEMFQAGFKYVKFLQAQLGILQSMKTSQEDNEEVNKAKLNNANLQIVTSRLVQEKLYARDKCLAPLNLIPLLKQHYDFPSISQHINEFLH